MLSSLIDDHLEYLINAHNKHYAVLVFFDVKSLNKMELMQNSLSQVYASKRQNPIFFKDTRLILVVDLTSD